MRQRDHHVGAARAQLRRELSRHVDVVSPAELVLADRREGGEPLTLDEAHQPDRQPAVLEQHAALAAAEWRARAPPIAVAHEPRKVALAAQLLPMRLSFTRLFHERLLGEGPWFVACSRQRRGFGGA